MICLRILNVLLFYEVNYLKINKHMTFKFIPEIYKKSTTSKASVTSLPKTHVTNYGRSVDKNSSKVEIRLREAVAPTADNCLYLS